MRYKINLQKENFKFSCSHFTIFSQHEAERLHGHNYQIIASVCFRASNPDTGITLDFNVIKKHIREICDYLDEYVLVPQNSPFLKIASKGDNTEIVFQKKVYSIPTEDVRLLPITNISTEELSQYIWRELALRLRNFSEIEELSITVNESAGQGIEYSEVFGGKQ